MTWRETVMLVAIVIVFVVGVGLAVWADKGNDQAVLRAKKAEAARVRKLEMDHARLKERLRWCKPLKEKLSQRL